MPRLIVKQGGEERTVELGDEAVTFGRTGDNTVPLDDAGASRKHAQVLFVGKGYEVVDLGSRNGTLVNGQKVPRKILQHGDLVKIGAVEILFQEEGADAGVDIEELDLGGGAPVAAARPAAAAAAPAGDCVLRFLAGEREGEDLPLQASRTTFGRRASNTVSFKDSSVSGVHAEITREPNGYVLRDLGSTNGTTVDGEPVVETVLRHNSRIRIGAQRIVFVDPTVADIESTLTADDEGGEWGMMRGELDVAAAGRRGGGAALAVSLAVVAAAAGGGWFLWSSAPRAVEIPTVKDNRIVEGSFEDGIVRWFSAEGDEAAARVEGSREKPAGRSGVHCLEVIPGGEGPGIVTFSGSTGEGDATVSPDTPYEISARVGGGEGAVVVTWLSSQPGLVREVSTPVVAGGPEWPEARAVVTAPANATGARVSLAAFGGRAARFDDVVFRRAESGGFPALASGDLKVRIDACGTLEAVRGGAVLLTKGGVAPSVETPPPDLLGATLSSPPALAGEALSAAGALRDGTGFRLEVRGEPGGAVIAAVPDGGGAGAFTFTCPSGLARGSVTVVMDRSALVVPEEESFSQEGVRKVIVGGGEDGPAPFVLSAPKGSPGFAFHSRRTGRGLRVQLAPPATAPEGVDPAAVRLAVDLSREDEAANALLQEANNLEARGQKGRAAEAFERLALEYHYRPVFRGPAETNARRLVEAGRTRLAEARRLFEGGAEFASLPHLERAASLAASILREYEGHPLSDQAAELEKQAAGRLGEVREEVVAGRVENLVRRARDYMEVQFPALALHLCEEILRVAPEGNEFRGWAEEQIPELRAEVTKIRRALYEPKP